MDEATKSELDIRNVDENEFARMMADLADAVLLDVRTPFEHESGRIEGSQLYDISDPEFPDRIAELDRDLPYLVYCRSGNRSYHAMMYMEQLGFRRVYNLEDGIIGWTGPIVEGA